MSSNIGPVAQAKYEEYLSAKTLEDRVKLLQEFLSLVPKHKATERIVALNKSRLAKLRREMEKRDERRRQQIGAGKSPFSIRKAENAQLILTSAFVSPGPGKSSILYRLTGAGDPDAFGLFTAEPQIGVYIWEGLRFQVIDMPSIMEGAHAGVGNGTKIFPTLRNADLLLLCIDLSRDVDAQFDLLMEEFEQAEMRLNQVPPPVEVERCGSGRIQVRWLTTEAKSSTALIEDIQQVVQDNNIQNAVVKISGPVTLDDVVDALNAGISYVRAVVIATKGDKPHTKKPFQRLQDRVRGRFRLIPTAIMEKNGVTRLHGLDDLGKVILEELDLVKIYTKSKRKGVADEPLVVERGSTIGDVALKVHKNFYEYFKFAFVYRPDSKIDRIKVGLNFEVQDEDVVELFATI